MIPFITCYAFTFKAIVIVIDGFVTLTAFIVFTILAKVLVQGVLELFVNIGF